MLPARTFDAALSESSKPFIPSEYQLSVGQWAEAWARNQPGTRKRHAVIDAFPGSGKTSTLKYLCALIQGINPALNLYVVAFNTAIRDDIKAKFKKAGIHARVSTINGLGMGALIENAPGRRVYLVGADKEKDEAPKYRAIIRDWLQGALMLSQVNDLERAIETLIHWVRVKRSGVTEAELIDLIYDNDLEVKPADFGEFWNIIVKGVSVALERGVQEYLKQGRADYDDQLWMIPYLQDKGHPVKLPQYDWIMLDEAQDSSPASQELIIRSCLNGHVVPVGDKRQAIYRFAGADGRAIPNLIERLDADVFPLPRCYRCPPEVIEQAAILYPGILSDPDWAKRSGRAHGVVAEISKHAFLEMLRPGDLVMSRVNVKVVSLCLQLIREGKRAYVKGKDIGGMIISILNRIEEKSKQNFSFDRIRELLEAYDQFQRANLALRENADMALEAHQDKIDTFKVLLEAYLDDCGGIARGNTKDFKAFLRRFFTDDEKEGNYILLSTAHRAKGLEFKRCFIYGTELMPHPKAKNPEDVAQERNLLYVAVTRALEELYYVGARPSPLNIAPELPKVPTLIGGAGIGVIVTPLEPEPEVILTAEQAELASAMEKALERYDQAVKVAAPGVVELASAPAALESPAQRLVREAAAKLNHPAPAHGEALAEFLPPGKTLLEAMDDPELQRQYRDNPVFAEILDAAFALEMQQTQEAFVQRGVVLSSDEELGKALGWPSPHQTPAPHNPQIIRVKVWGKWRDAEVLKVEKETVSVRILAQDVSAGMSAFWTLGREAVKSEHQALVWPATTSAVAKVEKSPILAALEPSATALAAERAAARGHYVEKTEFCPDCGAACDLSGYACWSCGVMFSNREHAPAPAQVVVVEADPPVPVVDETLCVKCHSRSRTELHPGTIHEQDLLCNWCREAFFKHAAALAKEAGRIVNMRDPEFWRAAWPSFVGTAEPAPVEAPPIVEVAPEPEAEPTPALPAPVKGMCVSCGQRQALNIVANHPELAVLCGACRADVLTKADQQAQATGWGHYEATVREVLARFLSDRPAPAEAVADADAPERQPREKKPKKEGKDYHTALDGSKARCQITMPTEDLETLKAMGLNPAEVFHELLHRWPPFLEALAAQQKASA